MAAYNSNTEADFIFASLVEFLNLWRSGKQGTFNIECREKTASLSFNCSLGHPDSSHLMGKKKKRKCKSKARAARDNARAAEHQAKQRAAISPAAAMLQDAASQQSQQSAAISPAEDREVHDPLEGDQSGHLVSEQPSVLKSPRTPKRPVSSPTESLSKRPAVSLPDKPSPGPSAGPKVQLPVWDSTEHPYEILREESRDQDISITADLLSDTERHVSDDEVKDSCEDEDDDENDKDEGEDEDEDGKEEDCRHWGCGCRWCNYLEALRILGASNNFPRPPTNTTHWPPPTDTHRRRRDTK